MATVWAETPISGVVTVTGKSTVAPSLVLGGTLTAPVRWTEIKAQAGTWAYTRLGGITYQWQACTSTLAASCANIPDEKATRQIYAPSSVYVGSGIRAVVTYTGPDGTTVSAATPISNPLT
jgi:hypothetical protein